MIWRYIKIRTNMKTYSAALHGTLNPWIWGSEDTWKSRPKWKTIQLLLMWLQIWKSCWSKDTWKSGPKWKIFKHIKHFSCSQCNSKSAILLIWRYMKIRTNMKTYSAALNGTLNLQIWGPKDTWKSEPKWKTIQLLLMKLKIHESRWSNDKWKSRPK